MTDAEKLAAKVKFAKAMGYERQLDYTVNPRGGMYSVTVKDVWIHRKGSPCSEHFDPWANPADALELADKIAPGGYELAWWPDSDKETPYCVKLLSPARTGALGSTLCDAICLAVLECLEAQK